jgi:D-alanyl-D-alanine carboxypeptidase
MSGVGPGVDARQRVSWRSVRRLRIVTVLALALAALMAVGARASGGAPHRERGLNGALRHLVHLRGGPPGAAAIVQRRHHLTFHTVGVRNVRTKQRWRRSDHMRIASVAKAFSGAVALSLVDRGRLKLNDTIGKLLPRLPAAWAKVKLRQALDHTSGLPDYTDTKAFRRSLTEHPRKFLSPRDVIGFVRRKPLEFTPGTQYHYSNTDNFIVAMMARAVSDGRSYRRLLRSKVNRPLGLSRTTLPMGFRLPRPFVHGYIVDPPHPPNDVSTAISASGAWASGGIQSTPADLNRFIRGYVGRRLFGRATQRRQFHFVNGRSDPPGPGSNAAGLGIFRYRTRCGTVYGHTGSFPGYIQFAASSPSGRRSVTVSVNEQLGPLDGAAFKALRHADLLAVCAALG